MNEEGSDDELPSISFQSSQNSSGRNVSMPSAGEVAAQRARERRTERELQRLDEMQAGEGAAAAGAGAVAGAARSDSSGSEGEAVLARCVRALSVLGAPPAAAPSPAHRTTALALLRSLPHADLLSDYITALEDYDHPARFTKLTDQVVNGLASAAAHDDNVWSEDEVVMSAGVLCCARLAGVGGGGGRVRRALQRVLGAGGAAAGGAARRLAALAGGAARRGGAGAARPLLALSDAIRDAAGSPPANLLSTLLVHHAVLLLLDPMANIEDYEEPSISTIAAALESGWRGAGAGAGAGAGGARLAAVRGAARALQGAAPGDRPRLLGALQAAAAATPRHDPDYLKVMVSSKTLQLLFREAPPLQS